MGKGKYQSKREHQNNQKKQQQNGKAKTLPAHEKFPTHYDVTGYLKEFGAELKLFVENQTKFLAVTSENLQKAGNDHEIFMEKAKVLFEFLDKTSTTAVPMDYGPIDHGPARAANTMPQPAQGTTTADRWRFVGYVVDIRTQDNTNLKGRFFTDELQLIFRNIETELPGFWCTPCSGRRQRVSRRSQDGAQVGDRLAQGEFGLARNSQFEEFYFNTPLQRPPKGHLTQYPGYMELLCSLEFTGTVRDGQFIGYPYPVGPKS